MGQFTNPSFSFRTPDKLVWHDQSGTRMIPARENFEAFKTPAAQPH